MALTTGMTPDQVAAQVEHTQLMALLPFLEHDIDRLMASVQARVFSALRDGSYTQELGDSAWREQYAYHQLRKNYSTRAKLGKIK